MCLVYLASCITATQIALSLPTACFSGPRVPDSPAWSLCTREQNQIKTLNTIPQECLLGVLIHAPAFAVRLADSKHAMGVVLFGSFRIPLKCPVVVAFHATTISVAPSNVVLESSHSVQ